MYPLNKQEQERLKRVVSAVLSVPFIDDLEDYIWEAAFTYVKKLSVVDPLTSIRSKKLFDVVDNQNNIGWSAKAVQCIVRPNAEFELVIQRADIIKKSENLGFGNLSRNSPPNSLGKALLKHWFDEKVEKDAKEQRVTDKRICVLLKSSDRKKFAYFEDKIRRYKDSELVWRWTDSTKTGLQGLRRNDNSCVFRWYPNQTQFFERFTIPANAFVFKIEPQRLDMELTVELLCRQLSNDQ